MKRIILAAARKLAGLYGLELAYPPRDEPHGFEPRGTLLDDGTPCSPFPQEPERFSRGPAERFRLGDPS